MTGEDGYPIGDVADTAHVTVRTLHHYDAIGLLRPSERTAAGHRRYTAADLVRLRQILVYRELEFGLDEIASMLADPGGPRDDHLRSQHRMLRERIRRHQRLLTALETEMEKRKMGIALTPEEQFKVFGDDRYDREYAQEAEQRWGDTAAWQESQRRTAAYTEQDWITIKAETDTGMQAMADLLRAGTPATSEAVMAEAETARQRLCRWFYECSPTFHRNLAELYVGDERFRATYEDVAPGLAQYVHDAITANAESRGA